MKKRAKRSKRINTSRGYLMVRVLIGLLGLTLSLVLHELFHVVMHWGHITHIDFFPNPWTVVEINTALPPGYDLDGEEVVAYGITLVVLLITVRKIFKVRDSEDKRTIGQILFPRDRDMQKLKPSEMLKLSNLDETGPTVRPPTHAKKQRRRSAN